MKKFLIAEAEKARILGMHYRAMGKKLVNEDYTPEEFAKAGIQQLASIQNDDIQNGRWYVYFTENTNNKSYFYQCATYPPNGDQPYNKPGAIYTESGKIANDPFILSQTPEFKKMMAQECRPVLTYLAQQKAKNAPQPQVAAATTAKVTAPNPVSDADVAAREKIYQQVKINSQQAQQQLTDKMADANYLNPNKEKAELDKEVKEISSLISSAGPFSGDLLLAVKSRINKLIKYKPEYKNDPYYLNPATMF